MSEPTNEVAITNENIQDEEQPNEEAKEEAKEEPKRVRINDIANEKTECNDCKKPVSIKTLRYSHPAKCEGRPSNIALKPVRKSKPKIKVLPVEPEQQQTTIREEEPPKAVSKPPVIKQENYTNPYQNMTQSQLLQLQYKSMNAEILRRKQEKANVLTKSMFAPKPKKR